MGPLLTALRTICLGELLTDSSRASLWPGA